MRAALELIGVLLVVVGLAAMWLPVGLVAAGLVLVFAANITAHVHEDAPR